MLRFSMVRDILFQARSLLRELFTDDGWVSGTWLHPRDWLALRLVAVRENNLLPPSPSPPPHLVFHKEIKPNVTLHDVCDETALPPQFDFTSVHVNCAYIGWCLNNRS